MYVYLDEIQNSMIQLTCYYILFTTVAEYLKSTKAMHAYENMFMIYVCMSGICNVHSRKG